MKALVMVVGQYLWRNRHELREKLERSEPAKKLSESGMKLFERLRAGGRLDDSDKDRPIEAEFRKIS